jgi:hypothetical protein
MENSYKFDWTTNNKWSVKSSLVRLNQRQIPKLFVVRVTYLFYLFFCFVNLEKMFVSQQLLKPRRKYLKSSEILFMHSKLLKIDIILTKIWKEMEFFPWITTLSI